MKRLLQVVVPIRVPRNEWDSQRRRTDQALSYGDWAADDIEELLHQTRLREIEMAEMLAVYEGRHGRLGPKEYGP